MTPYDQQSSQLFSFCGFMFQVLHIQSSHSHSVGLLSKFCASGRVSEVVICGCFFFLLYQIIFVEEKNIESILLEEIEKDQIPEAYGGTLGLVPIQDAPTPNWPPRS